MDLEMSTKFQIKSIGIIHSPYKTKSEAPHQGDATISKIEIFPEFVEGLTDIEEFSHLHIIYWLHQSESYHLLVKTPWDKTLHGLFATRSPNRINSIGYAVVELIEKQGNILTVRYLDAVDKTPVLDIKPYIPDIAIKKEVKKGRLENNKKFLEPRVYEFNTTIACIKEKRGILSETHKDNIIVGCAPEFGGKKEYWSPQHLFVASIELCLMTTFFWLLEKVNLSIISYKSKALGKAQLKNRDFIFTEITVQPEIVIDSDSKKDSIYKLIIEAGRQCMITKSVNCSVVLIPHITKQGR